MPASFRPGARPRQARARRAGACDEVNQLPPAHRRVVAVARGLAQYGQETIVELHILWSINQCSHVCPVPYEPSPAVFYQETQSREQFATVTRLGASP